MDILVGMKIPQPLKKELIKGLQGRAGRKKEAGEKRAERMTPLPNLDLGWMPGSM